MTKFSGVIGYTAKDLVEVSPGVWEHSIIETPCSGDILQNANRWEKSSDSTNDNLKIDNRFSIISKPNLLSNLSSIKYLSWCGIKWKVTKVEIQRPRLILTVGEVYNG